MKPSKDNLLIYLIGLLCIILLILAFEFGCSCKDDNQIPEELSIMNTVCIDGVLNFSVVNKLECKYEPVIINDNPVPCGEKKIDNEN